MNPSISFIIPVYNVQAYLAACLESVAPAIQPGDEIVLVDDGSTDDSPDICRAWQDKLPGTVKVVRQTNQGLSAARNRGLAEASKAHAYFLDSDDLLCAEAFDKARRCLAEHAPDILTCDALLWREGNARGERTRVGHSLPAMRPVPRDQALAATFRDDFLSSSSRIFQRDLLARFGPEVFPVGRTYEDNAAIPRLIVAADHIFYLPEPIFCYRIRPGSITQSHSLRRCLDQATSLSPVLQALAAMQGDSAAPTLREANLLAFKHVVRAVRNAASIQPPSGRHFEAVIDAGLATLTLTPDELLDALLASGNRDLWRHAQGMLRRRRRYVAARTLSAHWKQWRAQRARQRP